MDGHRFHGSEVADAISATIKRMQMAQEARIRQAVIAARLYGNASLVGVGGIMPQLLGPDRVAPDSGRLRDNVVQSVIDTATARIGENKPRPYFLTDGGSWRLQSKAKRLNKFAEGIFYEQKAYDIGSDAQRDGEVFGDGPIFVGEKEDRVYFERVLCTELWVDEVESAFAMPRELHWVRSIDRELLMGMFPDAKSIIRDAPRSPSLQYSRTGQSSDLVELRRSWHLPSRTFKKGEKSDGVYCVSIDGKLLCKPEEWGEQFFPFARFQWAPRPVGYWAQGLAERLQSKQIELNKLQATIQASMHRAGTYKVFLERGSKIVKEHVSNEIGAIVEFSGTKPIYEAPAPVSPDWYGRVDAIKLSMYEEAGVSLQSATGQKPAGLNSGEAQRVYRDTVAERLKTQERLNERGYIDLARIAIAMARRIAERTGKPYEVRSPQGRSLLPIKMSAEDLDDKDWSLQCFPTSSLPKDPAGRLATIQEYIQAGFMSPRQGRRALDFPDLEAIESLANADEDLITKILDDICDEGKLAPPEPTDNLELAKELVTEYINRSRLYELEPEKLDLLHDWAAMVDDMLAAREEAAMQAAAAMAPPMDAGGVPQAVPEAPPVSPLLPRAA